MSLPPPTTSADLAAASAAFARLRDTTPLGARITEALWSRVVELASTHGVGRVARTLRLDYARLKRRLHGESAVLAPAPPALEAIRALLAEHPELSRRAFSQRLCAHWDWRQPTRALRDGVCRSLLLALHRGGHLTLPPVRQQPPNNAIARRRPAPLALDTDPLECPLREVQPLELVAVRRTPQEGLYDRLIAQYHYLGPAHGVGEQVKYLAFSQGRPLACLGFTSAPRHLGPRDRFIGWSPAVRRAQVHLLGYNTRFLILPWVRVPHLASHLLGAIARRIAGDWEGLYGHPVHYLETFVDPARFAGTCYRAANWRELGLTTGRGKDDLSHRPNRSCKQVLGLPLHADFRRRLGVGA